MYENDLFSDCTLNNTEPVYKQIIKYIKLKIYKDELSNGSELPSRRSVSVALAVNLNTVQKAFKQLENEGILFTNQKAKSVIFTDKNIKDAIKHELTRTSVNRFVQDLKEMDFTCSDALKLVETYWSEND